MPGSTFGSTISACEPIDTFVLQNGAGQQPVLVGEDERMILDANQCDLPLRNPSTQELV